MNYSIIIIIILVLYLLFYINTTAEEYKNYKSITVVPSNFIAYPPVILYKNSQIERFIYEKLSALNPLKGVVNNAPQSILENINTKKNTIGVVSNYDYVNYIKHNNNNITLICDLFNSIFSIISPSENITSFKDFKNKTILVDYYNSAEYYILEKFQDIFNYKIITLKKSIAIKNLPKLFLNKSYHAYCKFIFYPNLELKLLYRNWKFSIFGLNGISKTFIKSLLPNYKDILFDKSFIYGSNIVGRTIQNNINIYTNKDTDNKLSNNIITSIYDNFKYIKHTDDISIKKILRTFNHYNIIDISNKTKTLHEGVREFYESKGYITYNPEPICKYFVGKSVCDTDINLNPYRIL